MPVDEGVMVAARSQDANFPLTCGCSFQVVFGARLSSVLKKK